MKGGKPIMPECSFSGTSLKFLHYIIYLSLNPFGLSKGKGMDC